ncbi:hypothetical protein GS501_01950 [Saccharibacter sp. 17.LH.SD]|uniref:glycosyltransferase family 2 protein n=1 Tax=Saccharibacter sp. 17.LH.SD TaxID=2689393 RepID=UPI00136EC74C|nr:glycosyltransferase family 2 protein [Saccharibacter sp. 17.LH.SD]MXV43816.1 hypothetical protein [Saccharibacter sp. 17.LH.SD]
MSDNLPSAACAVLVRNSQDTILNWISWHLSLGIRHIAVIDAGSEDGTSEIVQSLAQAWPVTWHAPSLEPEFSGEERREFLTRYAFNHLIGQEEWLIVLDSDEYLVPEPDLSTLLARGQDAAGIALNWCIYGSSGHRHRPRGHIVATHTRHATPSFADHAFTRLLVRGAYLTSPNHASEREPLDIPHHRLVTPQGTPLDKSDGTPHWEGGRIQHYICPSSDSAEELPPHHYRHFNRNDIEENVSPTLLNAARQTQNALWQTLLEAGLHRLRSIITQLDDQKNLSSEDDFHLPDYAQRPGFAYLRQRLTRREQLLLNPQAAPPCTITRAFLLRSTEGMLLEADPPKSHRPLIALIQEHNPRLLCLFPRDYREFTLGDVPTPMGMATVMTRRTHRPDVFSLPEETGHGKTLFEAVPLPDFTPPELLSLPDLDRRQGLSLEGLLIWIEAHPSIHLQDLQRALCLLTKEDAILLCQEIPELQDFLP